MGIKVLRRAFAVAFVILVFNGALALADMVYIGTINVHGSGIGSEATIVNAKLNGNAVGTTEEADLNFAPVTGADSLTYSSDTNVTGGSNNRSWNLGTDLGISQASELVLVLNINETGGDVGVILDRLVLYILNDAAKSTTAFYLQDSDKGVNYGGNIGIGAQGFVFTLDAAQRAVLDGIILAAGGASSVRVGAGFTASEVCDGFETVNVAKYEGGAPPSELPEPTSLILLGSGLMALGLLRRRFK